MCWEDWCSSVPSSLVTRASLCSAPSLARRSEASAASTACHALLLASTAESLVRTAEAEPTRAACVYAKALARASLCRKSSCSGEVRGQDDEKKTYGFEPMIERKTNLTGGEHLVQEHFPERLQPRPGGPEVPHVVEPCRPLRRWKRTLPTWDKLC